MQPLAKQTLLQQATPAFAALSAADAAPDTAYFHKFFEVKAQREAAGVRPSRKRKKAKEEEDGPLGSDDDSLGGSDAASDEIGEPLHLNGVAVARAGCRGCNEDQVQLVGLPVSN